MGFRRNKAESNVEVKDQPEPSVSDQYTDAVEDIYDQAGILFVQCAAKGVRLVATSYSRSSQERVVTCPEFKDMRSDKNYGVFSEAGKALGDRNVHDPKTQRLIGMEMGCFGCVSFTTGEGAFVEGEIVGNGPQDASEPIALPMAKNS